jgi:hypothetical protein
MMRVRVVTAAVLAVAIIIAICESIVVLVLVAVLVLVLGIAQEMTSHCSTEHTKHAVSTLVAQVSAGSRAE